jgi:tetratricopeptide (TPR) repeat protein
VLELALPLQQDGQLDAALAALDLFEVARTDPQLLYLRAVVCDERGDAAGAAEALRTAAGRAPGGCFPNRVEMIGVLERAIALAASLGLADGHAPYLLGNLLYDKEQHGRAVQHWEQAVRLVHAQPLAWRNLGLAYFNHARDPAAARRALRTAFELQPDDARLLCELDQLDKELGVAPAARLAVLDAHEGLVQQRDDLYVEHVRLLNTLGRPGEALARIEARVFHPWEGGEGRVSGEYRAALLQLAVRALDAREPAAALALLDRGSVYPRSLGEGRLAGQTDSDLCFWRGRALAALGRPAEARAAYEEATAGELAVDAARYYNDRPPEATFWAAMAMRELGRGDAADAVFATMAEHAAAHAEDDPEIDEFAVSLPDFLVFEQDLREAHRRHCLLLTAAAQLGSGERAAGRATLDRLLAERPDEQSAVLLRRLGVAASSSSSTEDSRGAGAPRDEA